VVHVLDASRSVTVAGNLLSKENKKDFVDGTKKEYEKLKSDFGNKRSAKAMLSFEKANEQKAKLDWENFTPVVPAKQGLTIFEDYDLNEIYEYLDWQPFFIAWEMHGKFPQILSDEKIGEAATKLYEEAQVFLKNLIKEKWLTARGVIGFWPANATGPNTVQIVNDDQKINLEFLRQQIKKAPGQPNFSLADFIKPGSVASDFIGAFAVSIHGLDPHIKRFNEEFDDYSKIMLQALADRLAEAFAELLHEKTRKGFWGYAKEETLSAKELIEEKYAGIRPAPGYPACPDHTEKYKLFELLDATKNAGIILTESLAMSPAPSVCGWYFANPESKYFGIGKISKDQVEDYAKRKNMSVEDTERWLRPQLDYDA
jgi:5-methyltetrahydrofolate--homocysteine methyltransferase